MKKMNSLEIKELLELHALWLRGESNGRQADLSGFDLSEADLIGANLEKVGL